MREAANAAVFYLLFLLFSIHRDPSLALLRTLTGLRRLAERGPVEKNGDGRSSAMASMHGRDRDGQLRAWPRAHVSVGCGRPGQVPCLCWPRGVTDRDRSRNGLQLICVGKDIRDNRTINVVVKEQ